MASIEGIRLRINKFFRLKFSNVRNKKLSNHNFTIISNNCWGGMIYESYNLEKQTPTVGLYIMPSDYIQFISNIREYLKMKLEFIKPEDSKYYDKLKNDPRFGTYPIGKLNNIEIMFLHYKSEEEAIEKWKRRVNRINWNRIIYKFNDQNGCSDEDINKFLKLPYENKVFITVKKVKSDKAMIFRVHQLFNKKFVYSSMEPFGNKITKYINNIKEIN